MRIRQGVERTASTLVTAVTAVLYCLFFANGDLAGAVGQPGTVRLTEVTEKIAIVHDTNGEWIENHASRELSRYLFQITGETIPLLGADDPAIKTKDFLFLIGKNSIREAFVGKGRLKKLTEVAESDGFIIESITDGGKDYLVLSGGLGIGTLYAVYTYLEDYCQVGFFADGDRVWKSEELAFLGLDRVEKPRFADRMTWWIEGYGGLYRGQMWDLDEWRPAIDWMAKNRLNQYWSGMGIYSEQTYPEYRRQIIKDAFRYIRQRGISIVHWDPDQTLALLKRYFGDDVNKDHLYAIGGGEGREVYDNLRRRYKITKEIDPLTSRVYHDMWSAWGIKDPPEVAKEYYTQFPPDLVLGPMDNLHRDDPMYKKYDYFWGREWYFAWLYGFGGADFIAGDLRADIRQLREVASDPRAARCRGMTLWSESVYPYYHPIYGFVLSRLAWDPLKVDPEGIFKKYCLLRYGPESFENMSRFWEAVLGWGPRHSPGGSMHRDGITGFGGDISGHDLAHGYGDLKPIREAIEYALLEKERLNGDKFYEYELTEVMRVYLRDLFNKHLVEMYRAYKDATQAIGEEVGEIIEPRPGQELLLQENFDKSPDLSGWEMYSRRPAPGPMEESRSWKVKNGSLTQTEGGYKEWICVNKDSSSWKDYTLKLKFKVTKPANWWFGVLFRVKNDHEFCEVAMYPLSETTVRTCVRSTTGFPMGAKIDPVELDLTLGPAGWHEIALRVAGDNVRVYYNGKLRFDIFDASLDEDGNFARGGFGFFIYCDREDCKCGERIYFDEIEAWIPATGTEEKSELVTIADPDKYQKSRRKFEEKAERLAAVMDHTVRLLSTRPNYYLKPMLDQLVAHNDEPNALSLKHRYARTENLWLVAYERRDHFEVVNAVYRKELEAYIDELRERLERRDTHLIAVSSRYKRRLLEIAQEYQEDPLEFERLYRGTTTELVEEIYMTTKNW